MQEFRKAGSNQCWWNWHRLTYIVFRSEPASGVYVCTHQSLKQAYEIVGIVLLLQLVEELDGESGFPRKPSELVTPVFVCVFSSTTFPIFIIFGVQYLFWSPFQEYWKIKLMQDIISQSLPSKSFVVTVSSDVYRNKPCSLLINAVPSGQKCRLGLSSSVFTSFVAINMFDLVLAYWICISN